MKQKHKLTLIMSKQFEFDPTASEAMWRDADALAEDSLITEYEADAFVADALSPAEGIRVMTLLSETPEFRERLLALREEFRRAWGHEDGDPGEEEVDGRRHDGVEAGYESVPGARSGGGPVLVPRADIHSAAALSHLALVALTAQKNVMPLRDQAAAFRACRTRVAAHQFFARFVHPVDGIWPSFCRALAFGKVERPGREEVVAFIADVAKRHFDLGCGSAWRDSAMLMFDCAVSILDARTGDDDGTTSGVKAHQHRPSAFREMKEWLLESPPDASRLSHVTLPVALCERSGRKAHIARLVMEMFEGGSGVLYPAPGMSLMPLEQEFRKALNKACDEGRRLDSWSSEHDVSFMIVPPEGLDVSLLAGGSLGGAMLYGILVLGLKARTSRLPEMLLQNLLRVSSPERVCFAGSLGGTPVAGIRAKIAAALEDKNITILVCDPASEEDIRAAYGEPEPHAANTWLISSPRNPEERLAVIAARDMEVAAECILVEQKIPPVFSWWKKPWQEDWEKLYVRRDWISNWLDEFVAGPERRGNRIALLLAPMGGGKTGYLTSAFLRRIAQKDAPVAHFIDRSDPKSADPALFMRSLCAQVCRKHRLPAPSLPAGLRAWAGNETLAAAQELVASLLAARDRNRDRHVPEVIYIDALDEAFGEGARFHQEGAGSLPDLLRAIDDLDPEWTSLRMVVTSRDAAIDGTSHLANLKKGPLAVLNLADQRNQPNVKADLLSFFQMSLKNARAAEKAAAAAEGNFLFARLYLTQRDGALGIKEMLEHCIGGGVRSLAERSGLSFEAAWVELVNSLGLLAILRTPVTKRALGDLIGGERSHVVMEAVAALPEFFEDGVLRTEGAPLRWLHSYIPEFILLAAQEGIPVRGMMDALKQANAAAEGGSAFKAWHAELAGACLKWQSCEGEAAGYAVRHLLAHLRHACMWDDFVATVTDVEFVRARLDLPGGSRDLMKSLHRVLKRGPVADMAASDRELLKRIYDILCGLNDADAKDWLHVFQELYNQLPPSYSSMQFFGNVESMLAECGGGRVWLRLDWRDERTSISHASLPHPCGVPAVAFSNERSLSNQWLLATAGVDRMVRIWKPYPPKLTKMIDPSFTRSPVESSRLGLPPTGVAFVKSAKNDLVTLWNGIRFMKTGVPGRNRIPLTPAGELHLAPETDTDVSIITGDPTGTPHSLAVPSACDIPLVAVGYSDGSAQIWDADHPSAGAARLVVTNKFGIEHGSVMPLVNTYGCVAISPDGRFVAVALPDQFIRIWRLDLGHYRSVRCTDERLKTEHPLRAQVECEIEPPVDRRVDSMAWSPDGRILAVGGGYDRGKVELWDIEKRTCSIFDAHQNSVWALAWLVNPLRRKTHDGVVIPDAEQAADTSLWVLITGSYDRTFALWSFDSIVNAPELPNGRSMRHAFAGKAKFEFELISRKTPAPLAVRAHQDVVLSIAVSPDHTLIATAGGDHEANVWDVEDLLDSADEKCDSDGDVPFGNVIHGGSISPDGDVLATASENGSLCFWDMHSKPVASPIRLDPGVAAAQTVRFSPAGLPRALLVGTKLGGACLCTLKDDFTEDGRAYFPGGSVTSVAFNPRSGAEPQHRLALGHESGDVTIHGDAGQMLRCEMKHKAPVRSLAFSPIAPVLATVGNDRAVFIWNYETGGCSDLGTFHQGRIKSAAFSPDGRWLATGGRETIRLWSTTSWSLEETIQAHTNEIWTLEWSPCGRLLASGAKDRTVRLWNMAPESKGNRKLASLPCSNSVVAIWFSPDSKVLHVADPGPERRKPACTVVEIEGWN